MWRSEGSAGDYEVLNLHIEDQHESLFSIVEQLNLLFEQHNIRLPPTWTTYKILKHVIANDKALFRDIDFLVDLSADLALSGNSCWFETATNFLALCG